MRFWCGLFFSVLSLCAIWFGLFLGQLGRPTHSSRWVAEAMTIKQARAAELQGQGKLVLVAGSNALFGLDSARLEQAWHRPVLNGAVNAGLLLPYVLASSQQFVSPGDIVLMPLEYPMFNHESEVNSIVIDYVMARDPAYWFNLPRLEQLRFVAHAEPARLLRGWASLPDSPAVGVYGGHHIDKRGDQTHTSVSDQTAQDRAERDNSRPWHYGRNSQPDARAWALLREYHAWLRSRGACLIMLPPVLLRESSYFDAPVERKFYQELPGRVRAQGIAYVGEPHDFMYPRDWFFNTDYHLTAEARAQHTEQVISLLGVDLVRWCRGAGRGDEKEGVSQTAACPPSMAWLWRTQLRSEYIPRERPRKGSD